jgi:SAM-dependent methyltransferase
MNVPPTNGIAASTQLGDPTTSPRHAELAALLRQVDGNPTAMVSLARLICDRHRDLAVDLCTRALDAGSKDSEVRTVAAEVLSRGMPHWHVNIVRDKARNNAYESALQRAIVPGCKVLEIGTGTGLLAMMAARAGAGEVITCEGDPAIAMAAQRIVALNGYADRVRVISKHSSELSVDDDLHGPADLLVSEILADDLLGEGTLPTLEHAYRHLLKPGALILPARGRVRVALADDDDWEHARMGSAAGFDLSPFNVLRPPSREIFTGASRLTLRSEPENIFTFDFASGGPWPPSRGEATLVASGRNVNGIAQWIALDMDGQHIHENRPEPGSDSSWWAVFYPFDAPIAMTPGQQVRVHARHDRGSLRVWADI